MTKRLKYLTHLGKKNNDKTNPPFGVAYISYKELYENVSTKRGLFELSTAKFSYKRERVRIGYICHPKRGILFIV